MLVIFDLNGTLTDPGPIGAPWNDANLGVEVLTLAVQSAMTDTVVGDYREFSEHLRSALSVLVSRRGLSPEPIDQALESATRLPVRPAARPALELLAGAGVRLAVLTNSGAHAGTATLEAAGLADRFEQILGVDAVRRFKPHPDVYHHALRSLSVDAPDALLAAAHAWDVWGAKRAGLRTAWIDAHERAFPVVAPEPDVRAGDLLQAARRIVETV